MPSPTLLDIDSAPGTALFLAARIVVDVISILLVVLSAIVGGLARVVGRRRPSTRQDFKSVLITGCGEGSIGYGLALQFAKPGVHLNLVSLPHEHEELKSLARLCRARGASSVAVNLADVRDELAMRAIIENQSDIDCVIANAGIASPPGTGVETTRKVLEVNLLGLANTVLPALHIMHREKRRGSIVMVSSLAGFASGTSATMVSYVASKHAVRRYAQSLESVLGKYDSAQRVAVTCVFPGFTDSKMTRLQVASGAKDVAPQLISLESACAYIHAKVCERRSEVAYPFGMYVMARLIGDLPSFIFKFVAPGALEADPFRQLDPIELFPQWARLNSHTAEMEQDHHHDETDSRYGGESEGGESNASSEISRRGRRRGKRRGRGGRGNPRSRSVSVER